MSNLTQSIISTKPIISTENYNIIKKPDTEYIFLLEFKYPNKSLINSLVKSRILKGATVTKNNTIIQFRASKVLTYNQFKERLNQKNGSPRLPINKVSTLTISLVTQLEYLIKNEGNCFLGYNTEDLIIIDDAILIYLGCDYLIKNIINNNIVISIPFEKKDFFVSPELLTITEIPSYKNYKVSYFSLGCLILSILLGNTEFYDEYIEKNQSIKKCLSETYLKDTPIYYFLLRILIEEPEKRVLLYL
jgi:hypothetical protein